MPDRPGKNRRRDEALRVRRRQGPRQALVLFHQLVRDHPRDAEIRFHLAETLDNLGRESQAIPHYHRALRLDPRHAHAYENYLYLASSYRNVRKLRAARRYLAQAAAFGRQNSIQRRLERLLRNVS
jgi:Flp pilus assembly protein TadD